MLVSLSFDDQLMGLTLRIFLTAIQRKNIEQKIVIQQ